MASTQQDKPSGFRPITVDIRPDAKFRPIQVGTPTLTAALAAERTEPPRSGAGSDRDAWAAYADAIGVTYPDDAGRDAIVAAVGSKTHPTPTPIPTTPDAGTQED